MIAFRATAQRLVCATALVVVAAPLASQGVPTRLTDAEFWKMVTEFSEPSGQFRSENFTSNEATFQQILPELTRTIKPGGVYVGVGPEQNFTYLLALKSSIGFIVDIRRQNMLQHLVYKALFELNPDRVDFVSRLFLRKRPPGLDTTATADLIMAAVDRMPPDSQLYRTTLAEVTAHLTRQHGFALDAADLTTIRHVFDAFYQAGPGLNYGFLPSGSGPTATPRGSARGNGGVGGRGGGGMGVPDFRTIMVQHDGLGTNRTFLATEANYRAVREMQLRNLIVPLVGDFSGPKALKAVGDYVRSRQAVIAVFYASNVEQYLFNQGDQWASFYRTASSMPFDSASTFIRSLNVATANRGGRTVTLAGVNTTLRFPSVISPVLSVLAAFKAGKLSSYFDVMALSHQ